MVKNYVRLQASHSLIIMYVGGRLLVQGGSCCRRKGYAYIQVGSRERQQTQEKALQKRAGKTAVGMENVPITVLKAA